ncbi:hypothetical protein G3R49_04685 [Shewanella sp. WXL01]|uniref:SpvB/TcaC N-terminal domain-containing protein n=1 Tax=Shewanella sp. WXL01 TaxID=2709721 RepID=UPI0014385A18|nr:SpvB/TcaC N-terminal domain-containing protein [Shewanella sp. WXL01]NKF49868.1 hypothetical protein [Shewanella sp. WXL01]
MPALLRMHAVYIAFKLTFLLFFLPVESFAFSGGGFTPPPVLTLNGSKSGSNVFLEWSMSCDVHQVNIQESLNGQTWTTVYSGVGNASGGGIMSMQATTSSIGGCINWDPNRHVYLSNKALPSYSYRINACSLGGCSAYSLVKQVGVSAPPVPSGISVPSTNSSGTYSVSWSASSGATGYQLQRQVNNGAWSAIYSGSNRSFKSQGMMSGTYRYRVRACSTSCSAWKTSSSFDVSISIGGSNWKDFTKVTVPDDYGSNQPPSESVSLKTAVMDGQASVSGGQASYQIPIQLPPGRNGVQPQVSLSYNSQSGNGIAGVGWSLNAGSSISRCGATFAQDGFTRSVTFDDSTDRLCYNGHRLIAVSGTYGQSGTTYRTEMDSFVKVVQSSHINSSSSYFTVYYPDGHTATFGRTSNSRFVPAGLSTPLTWKISQQSYSNGSNTIDYEYDNSIVGEHLLSKIYYTGTSNSLGARTVHFEYEARPDESTTFLSRGAIKIKRRLKSITSKLGSLESVSEFVLSYKSSKGTNRSLLQSYKKCVDTEFGIECTPSVSLGWKDSRKWGSASALSFSGQRVFQDANAIREVIPVGDVNGDGVLDWPGYNTNAEAELTSYNDSTFRDSCHYYHEIATYNCVSFDLDADGITDPYRISNGFLEVYFSHTDAGYRSTNIPLANVGTSRSDRLYDAKDINGDGSIDLIIYRYDAVSPRLELYTHNRSSTAPFYSSKQTIFTFTTKPLGNERVATNSVTFVGDVDGNGLEDLMVSQVNVARLGSLPVPNPARFLLNNSRGSSIDFTSFEVPASIGNPSLSVDGAASIFNYLIDINGDARADFLTWSKGGLYARINRGDASFFEPVSLGGSGILESRTYDTLVSANQFEPFTIEYPKYYASLRVADVNGDGNNELVFPGKRIVQACTKVWDNWVYGKAGPVEKTLCGDDIYGTYHPSRAEFPTAPIDANKHDDSIYQYDAIYFDVNSESDISISKKSTQIVGSATEFALTDAFGDGNLDAIFIYAERGRNWIKNKSSSPFGSDFGAYIVRNYGSGSGYSESDYAPSDYLGSITDGFGSRSEWRYLPLSTGKSGAGQDKLYQTDHDYVGDGYIHFASSMYVVQSFKQSNGQGGTNETQYAYKGAMYNLQGLGFTGFNQIWEKDMQRGKTVHSTFKQKFPEIGLLTKQTVKVGSRLISQTDNTWKDNPAHNVSGVESRYLHKSINQTWDLNGVRLAKTQTVVNDADIDAYSNIERRTKYHWDYIGTQSIRYVSVELADYVPSESNWWINKYNWKKIWYGKVIRNWSDDPFTGSDVSSWQTTTVNTWDSTHRKPTKTTVTASGIGSSCNRVEELSLNTYGMPNWVQVTGRSSSCGSLPVRKTQFTYTKNGTSAASDGYLPFVVTNAKGHKATTHYDMGLGLPVKVIDPNNLVTTTQYDGAGRPIEVASTGKPTQYLRYLWANEGDNQPFTVNTAKTVVRVTAAGQPTTEKYADSLGREVRIATQGFDGGYQYVDKHYDALGRLTKESTPYGNGSSAEYTQYFNFDALDRPGSRSIPNGTSGGLTSVYTYYGTRTDIDVEGRSMSRTYGAGGLLYETVDAKGGTNRFSYDGAKRPLVIQDANKQNIIASYNGFGHKTKVIDPNQGTTLFGYNTFGELDKQTDANGVVQTFTFDQLGRISVKKVTGGNAADTSTYTWDTVKKGLLTSEKNADVTRTYGYNTRSQLTSMTVSVNGISHTIKHQYDGFYGRPKALEYPNGLTLKYGYNDFGYLESTSNAASGYVYRHITNMNEQGHITGAQLGNQVMTQTNLYNPEGTLNYTKVDTALGLIHAHYYDEYDSFMNIKDEHNGVTGLRKQYSYDTLNRLTTYTFSNNNPTYTATVNYDYDSVGNFLKKTDYSANIANAYRYGVDTGCSSSQNAGPNAICRLTKLNGSNVSFQYDKRGNLLTGDGLSLVYNEMDKPISINRSGTTTTFRYGSDGMRVKQTRSSDKVTTYYVDKLYEADNDGSWRAYIEDVAVLSYTPSRKHLLQYTLRDRLGSATTLANHTGDIVTQRYFDPFGRTANMGVSHRSDILNKNTDKSRHGDLDITNRYRRGFTDHEHMNEQQLIHMNGRVYDYNIGRFLSVDPFIQSPTSTQSPNPYSYIMNNPLAGTDPTGYVAEEPELEKIEYTKKTEKVAVTGSRIKREVTSSVSGTATYSNGATQTFTADFSGGKLSSASVSEISNAGSLKQVAAKQESLSDTSVDYAQQALDFYESIDAGNLLSSASTAGAAADLAFSGNSLVSTKGAATALFATGVTMNEWTTVRGASQSAGSYSLNNIGVMGKIIGGVTGSAILGHSFVSNFYNANQGHISYSEGITKFFFDASAIKVGTSSPYGLAVATVYGVVDMNYSNDKNITGIIQLKRDVVKHFENRYEQPKNQLPYTQNPYNLFPRF